MDEIFPSYYHKFKCIADKCKNNCCIGWEIDIDEDTLDLYESIDGEIGDKIRKNIVGDEPHFALKEDGRCPFLNESGLCDIILELGDGAICDICYLHPRFSSFYPSFTETGLGLSCEEAARIILSEEEKTTVNIPKNINLTKEEKEFFLEREEILKILQDREISLSERFSCLLKRYNIFSEISLLELLEKYYSLERLSDKWTDLLETLKGYSFDEKIFLEFPIQFEQMAVYFIIRHLWDMGYENAIKFSYISTYFIGSLCQRKMLDTGKISIEDVADISRMYSSEIEYSDENIGLLLK